MCHFGQVNPLGIVTILRPLGISGLLWITPGPEITQEAMPVSDYNIHCRGRHEHNHSNQVWMNTVYVPAVGQSRQSQCGGVHSNIGGSYKDLGALI